MKHLKISVRLYNPEDQVIWDTFIKESRNGTIFNYRNFLTYHIHRTFQDHSLLFFKNGHLLAVIPAAMVLQNGRKTLFSHPGASFGGFIFKNVSFSICDDILEAFEIYCVENDFSEAFIIPAPAFYSAVPDETPEYTLSWKKYIVKEHYITSVIDLKRDLTEIHAEIQKRKKRTGKYFEKLIHENTITFEWMNQFSEFYPILEANKRRHHSSPTHSLDELIKLDRRFPGYFNLLMIYSSGIPIGGTLVFKANTRVAIIFYNMIDYKYRHLQPATLQVIKTIEWAKKHGYELLDFGVSQDPGAEDPLTPSRKLIRFKEELTSFGIVRKAFLKKF